MKKSFSIHCLISICLFTSILLGLGGCNKSAQTVTPLLPGNEFLTSVELRLVNTADANDVQVALWTQFSPYSHTYQPDSSYTSLAVLNLKANSTYAGQVIILDATKTPVDTVSTEILARENYHLLFFQPSPVLASSVVVSNTTTSIPMADWNTGLPAVDTTSGGRSINELLATSPDSALNLTITRTDLDANSPPLQIGLQDSFVTGAANNVTGGILRVVMRHQPNAKNGTYPPGSSDFDVTYAVNIQ
ncbi:MAG TPA: hypothetical protein VKR32_09075 [Puia sp.]|nr:hypothetical protein [Puia sp.]